MNTPEVTALDRLLGQIAQKRKEVENISEKLSGAQNELNALLDKLPEAAQHQASPEVIQQHLNAMASLYFKHVTTTGEGAPTEEYRESVALKDTPSNETISGSDTDEPEAEDSEPNESATGREAQQEVSQNTEDQAESSVAGEGGFSEADEALSSMDNLAHEAQLNDASQKPSTLEQALAKDKSEVQRAPVKGRAVLGHLTAQNSTNDL